MDIHQRGSVLSSERGRHRSVIPSVTLVASRHGQNLLCLGWLCLPGQREERQRGHPAPLVQRGDSMAKPCRGDCEAGGMIQLVFYCRDRKHRLGAASRCQSLSRRSPTAPFAQGRSGVRTAILSLLFCVGPAQRGSAVWERRHSARRQERERRLAATALSQEWNNEEREQYEDFSHRNLL